MPFTMKGYPEKWKEFEVIKRQKAIEIANAMLKEGYLEKMLFLLRRKSQRLVSSVIERRNQSIRRRELRTIPYSNNGKSRGG